jgi:hypothetical protein
MVKMPKMGELVKNDMILNPWREEKEAPIQGDRLVSRARSPTTALVPHGDPPRLKAVKIRQITNTLLERGGSSFPQKLSQRCFIMP